MKFIVPALLLLPSLAYAESAAGPQFSFIASFFQMLAALAIVVGLILVTWYASGRLGRGLMAGHFPSRHIRLVETRHISPKKSLVLVEVGGEYLLLSCSDDRLELVKQIDMLEEIEVVEEPEQGQSQMTALIRKLGGR